MSEIDRIQVWNELAGNLCKQRPLDDSLVKLYISLIEEEYNELKLALYKDDRVETLDALADLLVVTVGTIHSMGYPAKELLRVVNDSNYSKFCQSKDEAVQSVEGYSSMMRYKDVHYKQVGDYYVIFGHDKSGSSDENSYKVLKGLNYHRPEICDFTAEWDGIFEGITFIENNGEEDNQQDNQDDGSGLRKLLNMD